MLFLYLGEPTLEYVWAWLETSSVKSGPIFLQVNRGKSGRVAAGVKDGSPAIPAG